jgi:hypothetical protein
MPKRTDQKLEKNLEGIKIDRDVSMKVSFFEVLEKVPEVASAGFSFAFLGDVASSGLSALAAIGSKIKIESSFGDKVLTLVALSFAWSVDCLRDEKVDDPTPAKDALKEVMNLVRKKIDSGNEVIPYSFIRNPSQIKIYRFMRDVFIEQVGDRSFFAIYDRRMLEYKFDAAFERGVLEILVRRPEVFESISPILNDPVTAASERNLNWLSYQKKLISDFEVVPVFGQEVSKISLSQIYVPLRCIWPKEEDHIPTGIAHEKTHHIKMLDQLLDEWLRDADVDDYIRLIGGGPGSGKSTSLKALARRVAEHGGYRPLYIPMQRISLDTDLRQAIDRFFVDRTNGSFTRPPLTRESIENGPPILLIFDGLDELARPGEAANEVVNLFSSRLAHLFSALRGDGSQCIKIIVSGRMPSFQAARKYIGCPSRAWLEVLGFGNLQFASRSHDDLWVLDQRPTWWTQYAALTGNETKIPEAFSAPEIADITNEPLLCYLLVLSGFATSNWEEAADNRNRIYRTLVDQIWERGWGDDASRRTGPGRTLTKRNFNTLMQTIALSAWLGGDTRVASEQGFRETITIARAEQAWEEFMKDNGADVTNLALNFYLRASESGQRGFEFTHKSFGDYLAARALLDVALGMQEMIVRRMDVARSDWVNATGKGSLSMEILSFLRDEVRLRIEKGVNGAVLSEMKKIKVEFERMAKVVLEEGLPMPQVNSWRTAETRQKNSEVMIWAIINALSLSFAEIGIDEKFVRVDWPDAVESLGLLIGRIRGDLGFRDPAMQVFSYIVAPKADLFGISLLGADFRGADFAFGNLAGTHLIDANLNNANLMKCSLQRSNMDRARLFGADLSGANLTDSRVDGIDFSKTKLDGAVISEITLFFAGDTLFEKLNKLQYSNPLGRNAIRRELESTRQKGEAALIACAKVIRRSSRRPVSGE